MKHTRRMWTVLVVLFALSAGMRGQQDSGTGAGKNLQAESEGLQSKSGVLTLHTGTHMVVLDVVVTDKKGHTVPGLTQDAFHIFEDGQPQTIEYFEEHTPVDPALVAEEKAELAARLPVNTFTNYEPFTGNPPMVLLLNEVGALPSYDYAPLHRRMLAVVHNAPAETPFVVYELDSQLRLVLSLTTNRDLVTRTLARLWDTAQFSPDENASDSEILDKRRIFTDAMQQFAASFQTTPGRKTIFAFTGGLQCALGRFKQDCVAPLSHSSHAELTNYLCGVMDVLEQGRISLYRYYPAGEVVYGFGCDGSKTTLPDVFQTNSHYYTLYYSPANEAWNGAYRRFRVDLAGKNLHATYRMGYYARPENIAVGHFAAATDLSSLLGSAAPGVTATSAPGESAETDSAGGAAGRPPNPAPVVFTVQVSPAAAPATGVQAKPPAPGNAESEADRLQGYRDYTLNLVVPAAELKVARVLKPGETPAYTARLAIAAVSYVDGHAADAKTTLVTASFDGPTDSQIAKGEIRASLTLQVPEKGNRLLQVIVRDAYSGQTGTLDIPVEQVVSPAR